MRYSGFKIENKGGEVDKDIVSKLQQVQSELVAPKGQYNSFGKYNYRSCEDILEALKPLLAKYGATVILSDNVKEVGGRVYVEATATFRVGENYYLETKAWAREPESQKGMNDAQITGSVSSYARKYALNGLFAIDDTKDADTQDNSEKPVKPPVKKPPQKTEPVKPQSGIQKWLNTAKAEKKRIGGKAYYTVLGGHGLEHANEAVDRKLQIAIYSDWATIKRVE
jgi:hypothetical protein